jgi:hypothetical protein
MFLEQSKFTNAKVPYSLQPSWWNFCPQWFTQIRNRCNSISVFFLQGVIPKEFLASVQSSTHTRKYDVGKVRFC